MRFILVAVVISFGTVIGVNAINNVSNMQDAKMTRFCKQIPVGASYDEMCREVSMNIRDRDYADRVLASVRHHTIKKSCASRQGVHKTPHSAPDALY